MNAELKQRFSAKGGSPEECRVEIRSKSLTFNCRPWIEMSAGAFEELLKVLNWAKAQVVEPVGTSSVTVITERNRETTHNGFSLDFGLRFMSSEFLAAFSSRKPSEDAPQ